ncbi:MAG: tRNA pseudouridine(38-40) synthase TruA [Desulfovibrionaceae bacterium]|nr:tRNA pseudouridine(38-40) synthase TruA [Desulfovibrionaceae bacterium]
MNAAPGTKRIKLTLSYIGTRFAGWQVQSPQSTQSSKSSGQADEHSAVRTVQGELEAALSRILGEQVRAHGAGRTDAGVHADMQAAHFDAPERLAHINWPAALRRLLPPDIGVLMAEEVPPDFHARFSATGKIYTYILSLSSSPPPPKLRPFVWNAGPLDLERMDQAAMFLLGEHDFASFRNAGNETAGSTRRLDQILRIPWNPFPENQAEYATPGLYWAWRFTGNGFLKQMVRNLMGFLAAVGRGKLSPEDAGRILAAKDRRALPSAAAPARGLTLSRVLY